MCFYRKILVYSFFYHCLLFQLIASRILGVFDSFLLDLSTQVRVCIPSSFGAGPLSVCSERVCALRSTLIDSFDVIKCSSKQPLIKGAQVFSQEFLPQAKQLVLLQERSDALSQLQLKNEERFEIFDLLF